ncbi:SDR family NAD(P)-dependent oxidoreductase [Kerstersia gyiorum]|uniref:NAD(P)-dependent dehydrogenase (Short-subunit alcohol dehydrogenase family) n=1 Tax=Kerstersia gyiorum TaxID=206506 RepID=A0A4Q7MXA1_9BURK|nr:SDR family oxidoreductase [Kerstersia gyiorum]KAB0541882.1 SDR family oxidoreductase [Kerstersia gyiorum]MCP1632436.1 NAD(P)-dependent dehydrogenase (short-subunit alcohol dehydrogenase family) [Kerstersia gyiorum]MCP1670016.1 NAD(P)-dependent dehydrogenase (short-subunit alcohol dehydrogenase family) [Kerstersia gyiorum]MCP1678157.1 NAD(P)-dependent dehydrogenase (short-subunit alcohol dehydrogenase family) [Kerstersia gyiorum]MCP1680842.1 NAD(P)-dependent dehydrogenase (short-subunit alco
MKRLEGKVAIVTGAAVGIGRAIALRLAQEGAKVAVTDVQDGAEVVDTISKLGGLAKFWRVDTTDEASVAESFIEVAEYFGRIDILVNNAGISGVNKPTHEITEAEWDRVMDVNVKGVFFCTKHAVPTMQEQGGGSIINLSSIYGLVGAADLPPYHASKGAVRLMSKNDALLYARDHIRVNSVHPGFIWTPLVEDLANNSPAGPAAFRAELDARHPLGYVGDPDDIAWGVVYLASDEAKFVTGSELVIDGGYTAR